MRGRNWLVRRTERRLGPELGQLRHIASSRHVFWKLLIPCLAVGFLFGAIGEFITPTTSTREPGHFADPGLFIVASTLTGLVLWSMTLLGSFRKLLVFDRGIVARYSQTHSTLVFPWAEIAPAYIKAVTTADGTDPDRRLVAREKTSLGVAGRNALVFRARNKFWVFSSDEDPAAVVGAIQNAMHNAGISEARRVSAGALPAVVVTGRTALA
ncbi:hypothetical protein StoSoilB5_01110 [Arthrobacter sp. StoSoilB5]|nr:hypothetical protein StoSoilB5_01110 [Arthrobacter sp. StoSoilB5]